MTCHSIASTCNGEDVRPVKLFMRSTLRELCVGCRASLEAHGASFEIVERRGEDRPFRPLWLRNLTARDETGRLVA